MFESPRVSARQLVNRSSYESISVIDDAENDESDDSARSSRGGEIQEFQQLAEMGELDFYTCVALEVGLEGFQSKTIFMHLVRRLPVLVALQFIVPICLVSFQMKLFEPAADDTEWEFRVIGFIVYLYSVWNMYDGSFDECRTVYLELAYENDLPLRFTWVAFIGEFINAFTGFALVLTLFTVFVLSVDPFNLVINSLAINYLGNVDNEFTDETLKVASIKRFEKLVKQQHWDEEASSARNSAGGCGWHMVFSTVLAVLRNFGTLGLGHVFAVLFLIGKVPFICETFDWMEKVPNLCPSRE